MAIAIVGSQSTALGNIGSSGLTLTIPGTTTANNTLVATVVIMNGTGDSDETVSSIAGWTVAVDQLRAGVPVNQVNRVTQFYKIATGSETEVVVSLTNSRKHAVQFAEFSGLDAVTPLDKTNSTDQPSLANSILTGTTGTLSQAEEVAIAAAGWGDDGWSSDSWDSGFTETFAMLQEGGSGADVALAMAYNIVNATTALNPQHSVVGTAEDAIAVIATYKAAGGAPAPITGSIAATEEDDAAALTGSLANNGSIVSIEQDDVAALTGTLVVPITGAIASAEQDDAAALTGSLANNGSIVSAEQDDVAALIGIIAVPITGSIAAAEQDDIAALTGTLDVPITVTSLTEADVWRVIIDVLRTGLDSQGLNSILIKQSFQPVKQGVDIQDTVYLFKITSKRYGHQGKNFVYNSGAGYFDVTENYWIEATFQLSALVQRDIFDSSSLTSYDVADRCAAIMQTEAARKTMLNSGIGILRVTDVRNPFSLNDRDQFEQDSNFDFILTYNKTISSIVPIADPISPDIQRV